MCVRFDVVWRRQIIWKPFRCAHITDTGQHLLLCRSLSLSSSASLSLSVAHSPSFIHTFKWHIHQIALDTFYFIVTVIAAATAAAATVVKFFSLALCLLIDRTCFHNSGVQHMFDWAEANSIRYVSICGVMWCICDTFLCFFSLSSDWYTLHTA